MIRRYGVYTMGAGLYNLKRLVLHDNGRYGFRLFDSYADARVTGDWLEDRDNRYPKRDLPWPAAVVNNCPCREGGVMCQARQETTIAVHRPRTTP